jgi:hypothetical protein
LAASRQGFGWLLFLLGIGIGVLAAMIVLRAG